MQGSKLGRILSSALLLGAASLGCSREEEPSLRDRYARRFLPFDPEWRRESEIPTAPQRYPRMVMWEVSNYPPGSTPTPEQQRAADDLVERCRAAAVSHGWHDPEKGIADGFHPPRGADGEVNPHDHHYRNDAYMLDDRILDCDRPEYLMYHPRRDGTKELVGFMFFARTPTEHGPQIGGPSTVWHFHKWSVAQCMVHDLLDVGWALDGECEEGVPSHRSAEMLHVWLVDRPNGPFSTAMQLNEILDMEGIDALFVAPEGDDLDLFDARLDAAIARLDEEDRRLVSQSISYLAFAFGKGLTETGDPQPEAGAASDPVTRGRIGLLRAAQKRGSAMRLRHFPAMAFDLDQLRPELWAEYEATHEIPETHETGHPH
jgi:hypothetical protein